MNKLHLIFLCSTLFITHSSWTAEQETKSADDQEVSFQDLSTFFRELRNTICTEHTDTWTDLAGTPPSAEELEALGDYPKKMYSLIEQVINLESSSEKPKAIESKLRRIVNQRRHKEKESTKAIIFMDQLFRVQVHRLIELRNLATSPEQRTQYY